MQSAVHNLEIATEEQRVINEEALSVNEEYQSTNEELLTSKEELQSLNEELTALNGQLQETLERQRTTANDLQNVLYSTDVATLFLDTDLNIRFFTPATKVAVQRHPRRYRPAARRPAARWPPTARCWAMPRRCCETCEPIEREIEAESGVVVHRAGSCRTAPQDDGVGRRRHHLCRHHRTQRRRPTRWRRPSGRRELANAAKSRFLAAASHDLRQPLQTLALLQGLLAKAVEGEKAQKLVARLDETLGAMSAMLNALLDINQIEAGTVRAEIVEFPDQRSVRPVAGRVRLSRAGAGSCPARGAVRPFDPAAIRACSSR